MALASVGASPATADHGIAIIHAPPEGAYADVDLGLTAGVLSTCPLRTYIVPVCHGAWVWLHWLAPDGSGGLAWKRDLAKTTPGQGSGVVAFVVPGEDVQKPTFIYRLHAYQEKEHPLGCGDGWACDHDAEDAEGPFFIPVTDGPIGS